MKRQKVLDGEGYASVPPPPVIPTRICHDDIVRIMAGAWTEPDLWLDAVEELGAMGYEGISDAHETLLNEGQFTHRTLLQKLEPGTRFRCAVTGRYGVVIRTSVLEVVGRVVEGVATLVLLSETQGTSGIHGRELRLIRPETVVLTEGD